MIKERVNSQSFKTWFEPIIPQHLQGGTLTVQVPSQFFYDWLEEHYYGSSTQQSPRFSVPRHAWNTPSGPKKRPWRLNCVLCSPILPPARPVFAPQPGRLAPSSPPSRAAAREDGVSSSFPNYSEPALYLRELHQGRQQPACPRRRFCRVPTTPAAPRSIRSSSMAAPDSARPTLSRPSAIMF